MPRFLEFLFIKWVLQHFWVAQASECSLRKIFLRESNLSLIKRAAVWIDRTHVTTVHPGRLFQKTYLNTKESAVTAAAIPINEIRFLIFLFLPSLLRFTFCFYSYFAVNYFQRWSIRSLWPRTLYLFCLSIKDHRKEVYLIYRTVPEHTDASSSLTFKLFLFSQSCCSARTLL